MSRSFVQQGCIEMNRAPNATHFPLLVSSRTQNVTLWLVVYPSWEGNGTTLEGDLFVVARTMQSLEYRLSSGDTNAKSAEVQVYEPLNKMCDLP